MQASVQRRLRQEKAGEAAADEQRDEAQGEQHRRCELDLAAPQRAQPVEGLDRGRHADGHGENRKGERRVGAHPADEHVMAPDARSRGSRCRTWRRPWRGSRRPACAKTWRASATPRPCRAEWRCRPRDGRRTRIGAAREAASRLCAVSSVSVTTSPAGDKEAGACEAIEQQQNARREQNAERQQAENRGDEPGPAS